MTRNDTPLTEPQRDAIETAIRGDAKKVAVVVRVYAANDPHVAMAIIGATIEHILAPLPPAEARQLITDWLASFDANDTNAA